jgi:hypothetical protein
MYFSFVLVFCGTKLDVLEFVVKLITEDLIIIIIMCRLT